MEALKASVICSKHLKNKVEKWRLSRSENQNGFARHESPKRLHDHVEFFEENLALFTRQSVQCEVKDDSSMLKGHCHDARMRQF